MGLFTPDSGHREWIGESYNKRSDQKPEKIVDRTRRTEYIALV